MNSGKAQRGVGYRIGQIIYFALTLFLCVAGLRSVLIQVFFPYVHPHQAVAAADCERTIRELQGALTSYEADTINGEDSASESSSERVFFSEWDQRFNGAGETCEDRHPQAYSALGRLRYSVEASLSRHREREASLVNEINAALTARTH